MSRFTLCDALRISGEREHRLRDLLTGLNDLTVKVRREIASAQAFHLNLRQLAQGKTGATVGKDQRSKARVAGRPFATRPQKLNWLRAHRHLWKDWPDNINANRFAGREGKRNLPLYEIIVEGMQQDGMISPKTNWYDVPLIRMICEARSLNDDQGI